MSSQPVVPRPAGARARGASAGAVRRVATGMFATPTRAVVAGCLLLGALSVVVLSWVPSSDPWAWIDWGQEISSPTISFGLVGGPSWKPFPAFFTTVFALFGGAAPSMWLIVTRTAALLAIVAAFRLGK